VNAGERTVLVVEDDSSMRLLCRVNLELKGYRVVEAAMLSEAREILATEKIDFVLLDVHLAGESGYELIETIRQRQTARIALITGSAEVSPEQRKLVDTVLPKPFDPEELSAMLGRMAGAAAQN
jgi:two-component system, OmpR family, torCAD operon response regulator TorR